MLRVLVVDREPIVRKGIRSLVESHSDWEVCGEARDGQEALDCVREGAPDVVVLDVTLPVLSGLLVTQMLGHLRPTARALLYTTRSDDESIEQGLAAGARGYVLKSDSAECLETAIHALGGGRPYFSPAVAEVLLTVGMSGGMRPRENAFTIRELEIAKLIAEGLSNKHIARQLARSVKTVESHRANAMRKAGVHTAADFIRFAIKQNLIQA